MFNLHINLISFDRIAELMGVPSASFVDTYNTKVTDLMLTLVEYMHAMDNILNPPHAPGTGSGAGTGTGVGAGTGTGETSTTQLIQKSITLEKNDNGFPILPDPIPSVGWKKTTWDSFFTDYLGQQYILASGGIKRHIPYKRISENQQDFIENKYLPHETSFRCPRNITMAEMKTIFDHFLERQRTNGAEDTFKFKSIKIKGQTMPAKYQIISNEDETS